MNKKPIIFMLLLTVVSIIVGGTIAYYTSNDTFENEFDTSSYTTQVLETFQSPDDWTPGTTTPKTIVATNKGDTPVAVRMCFDEKWEDSEGNELPLTAPLTGSESGYESIAIINYSDSFSTRWINDSYSINANNEMCYYYKTKLDKDESTTSPIDSVTFNPNVTLNNYNNCVTENDSTTCTTEYNDYAKYTLNVTVEMVQYDQYKNIWNTDIDISEEDLKNYSILYGLRPATPEVLIKDSEKNNYFGMSDCKTVYINSINNENKYYSCNSGHIQYIDPETYNANDIAQLKKIKLWYIPTATPDNLPVLENIDDNTILVNNGSVVEFEYSSWSYSSSFNEYYSPTDKTTMNFSNIQEGANNGFVVDAPQAFTMVNHNVKFIGLNGARPTIQM